MDNVENTVVEEPVATEPTEPVAQDPTPENNSFAASEHPEETPVNTEPAAPAADPEPEFKKDEDEDKDSENKDHKDEDEEDEDKKKFAALETEHAELQEKFSTLETTYNQLKADFEALTASHSELVQFKNEIEDAKKDAMIQKFCMLSDEDKKDIIANKSQFTVDEIEEKLSVICFRKKISFTVDEDMKTEDPVTVVFSHSGSSKPAWLSAVDNIKNKI